MVLFMLCIKADLTNIESVSLPKDAQYILTVKNSSGEDTREGVVVSTDEVIELSGSRGTANFAMKWVPDSKHQAYLNVMTELKGIIKPLTADHEGKYVPIVAFDCRGLEPIAWLPNDSFIVKGAGGRMVWEDVDLSEGEWVEYHESCGGEVSIMDLKWKFEVHKG